MTLFRINIQSPFRGPHQESEVYTSGTSVQQAKAAMILVHGRGATAQGILSLTEEFDRPDFHYLAPQAQNNTWYPFSFLEKTEKNEPGISSGMQVLYDSIQSLTEAGIPQNKIILLGFSQGACLVSEFAARHPQKYGGIVILSGGLIGPEVDVKAYSGSLEKTPVFIGSSDFDPHIPQSRIEETAAVLSGLNGSVNKKIYTAMGHSINREEITTIIDMMNQVLNYQ